MKAKRFTAPSMKKALDLVSKELGKDAVILSNKKVEGGVEVVAALDYQTQMDGIEQEKTNQHEVERQLALQQELERARKATSQIRQEVPTDQKLELFSAQKASIKESIIEAKEQRAKLNKKPDNKTQQEAHQLSEIKQVLTQLQQELNEPNEAAAATPTKPLAKKSKRKNKTNKKADVFSLADNDSGESQEQQHQNLQLKKTHIKTGAHTRAKKPTSSSDPLLHKVSDDIKQLKNWLVSSQHGDAWNAEQPLTWQQTQIRQRCLDLGVDASWADELVAGLCQDQAIEKLWQACLLNMSRKLPIAKDNILDKAGCYALVGPTGAGKTTTIGKLAAQYVVKHGADKVALITLDTYRIAAHEQLKSFSRLMGVSMHVLPPEGDLNKLLQQLKDKEFILIDTAGLSIQDPHFSVQVSMLKSAAHRIKKLLTLPLTSQARCLQENYEHFYDAGLDGCLFTKLDECFSLGQALSVAAVAQLPINMVADGPHIPDDLHFPDAKKLVGLAEQMARLAQSKWQAKTAEKRQQKQQSIHNGV